MNNPLTKDRLTDISKKLAYMLVDNGMTWREHDFGKSLLDCNPGEEIEKGFTFKGLIEIGSDGKPGPLSQGTKDAMREAHDNITGTRERRVEIPKDWTAEETALACLVVEGAVFRTGFKPFIFRETGDLLEISMDSGYTNDTVPEKIVMRTNVSGAIESLDYKNLAAEIDTTIDSIFSGWTSEKKKGRQVLAKKIDITGSFPFLDQFAEHYAKAMGLENSIRHISAGKGGLAKCSAQEAERHMILYEQAGYPFPRVGVELSGELAKHFTDNMGVTPVKTQNKRDLS